LKQGSTRKRPYFGKYRRKPVFWCLPLEKICEAAEYVYSPVVGTYLNKQGLYYTAKIIGQDTSLIIEDDLEMEYLPVDKAIEVLYLESQKWAVQQWMDKKNGKTTA
jgi:hypothetical protein